MSAQVAADLRAAADVLERDGWVRMQSVAPDGRCCAIGALLQIADGQREDAAYDFLREYVSEVFGVMGVSIWNDFHAKSAGEVIAALRAAADRAEADR